jgi:DNA-binding transcriptional ArsR family regulator
MELLQAVQMLDSLAQETRLEVFRLLVKAGDHGLAPGQIAEHLGVPPTTLSFHLKELKNAGIVRVDRHGRNLVYRADYDAMGSLLGFLGDECCVGVTISGECIPDPVLEGVRA